MRNWSMPKEVKRQRIFWVHQNILNLLKHHIVFFVKLVLGIYMDPENIKYFIRLRSVILERFQSISRSLPSWSDGSGDAGSCSLGGWEAATGWSGDFWPDYKYLKKLNSVQFADIIKSIKNTHRIHIRQKFIFFRENIGNWYNNF